MAMKLIKLTAKKYVNFFQIVADRWGWQQSSGLMPVFEEDEEEPAEEHHIEENLQNQREQVRTF